MASIQPPATSGEPAWEIAHLFPLQGYWSEGDYLALKTNRLVEFSHGYVEVLPMPTELHQLLLAFLYETFKRFVARHDLGKVLFAPLKVKLSDDTIREPDLVFMTTENAHRRENKYWHGADLVLEIVSEDDLNRDLVAKREEYAKAGICEYWIVDPRNETVIVLTLPKGSDSYVELGKYTAGQQAPSVLLEGLTIDVAELFSQT